MADIAISGLPMMQAEEATGEVAATFDTIRQVMEIPFIPNIHRAIVKFAQKCALDPQGLAEADYEAVREQGVSDVGLMDIIALAALGNYLDTMADAMKIDVDAVFTEALRLKLR